MIGIRRIFLTSCKFSCSSSTIPTFSKSKPLSLVPRSQTPSKPSKDALVKFLRGHLKPYFTPNDLLRVLKKLYFHPYHADSIVEIFHWASNKEGFRHDHTTYEWIIRTLASQNRFPQTQKILDDMAASPCPCSSEGIFCCPRVEPIYICVINSYIRVSRVDEGLAAFEKMKKYIDGKPPVVVYNIILNGLVKSGRIVDAKGFYEGMVRARVLPDIYTLNILLNGLCRVGDIENALRVLRESGCRADVVSFNTLIRGLCRGKRVEEGIALCSEMIGMEILPSMATLVILFDGLIGEGKAQDCVGLLNEFLDRGTIFDKDPIDYFGLVDTLCRAGEVGCALEVVNEMWDKGYPPSVVAGTTLLDGLCKDGRVQDALVLMGRMLKCSILPDGITLNLVLESLCKRGRVDEAEELRVLAVSGGWECDEVTYNVLMDGFCKQGRVKEGVKIVDEMLDKGFINDLGMYNMLMDRLKRSKTVGGHNRFPVR